MLPGITYDVVLELAAAHGLPHEVREVPEAEVRGADELWMTSSTKEVLPITTLDGQPVGNGRPGPGVRAHVRLVPGLQADGDAPWRVNRSETPARISLRLPDQDHGRSSDDFAQAIAGDRAAVTRRTSTPATMEMRASSQAATTSASPAPSTPIPATQLDALYRELSGHPSVVMVL